MLPRGLSGGRFRVYLYHWLTYKKYKEGTHSTRTYMQYSTSVRREGESEMGCAKAHFLTDRWRWASNGTGLSRFALASVLGPLRALRVTLWSLFPPPLAPVLASPPTISAHLGAGTTDFRRFPEGASTTVTRQKHRTVARLRGMEAEMVGGASGKRDGWRARGRGDNGSARTTAASNVSLS